MDFALSTEREQIRETALRIGQAYAIEFHVERLWRDACIFAIAPVPQELIPRFIATNDLGLPRSY